MVDNQHYKGHRQRLRDRLTRDSRQLADYEILELLLGYVLTRKDTKPLAKELLARFSTLSGVFSARPEELRTIPGFGPGLESFWTLWREMWARLAESPVRQKDVAGGPEQIAAMAMARLGTATKEEFWVVLVDNTLRILAWEQVAKGTVGKTAVYPREVMKLALDFGASGIFLVHNHPSGDPKPSPQDEQLTDQMIRTGRELEVRVLDHIVVAQDGYFSFHEHGYL